MTVLTCKLTLLHCWGGESTEPRADGTGVELDRTCFAGGSVIQKKNIFEKQFAYHRVIKMFKPFDLVILHVGIYPKEIV